MDQPHREDRMLGQIAEYFGLQQYRSGEYHEYR